MCVCVCVTRGGPVPNVFRPVSDRLRPKWYRKNPQNPKKPTALKSPSVISQVRRLQNLQPPWHGWQAVSGLKVGGVVGFPSKALRAWIAQLRFALSYR